MAVLAAGLIVPVHAQDHRHLVVIGGIGGEPHYDELFHRWATTLVRVAVESLGIEPANVHYLPGSRQVAPGDGKSRSATGEVASVTSIGALLDRAARASSPGDMVLVVLIGHGTARAGRILFNVEGPDLSAGTLAEMLASFDGRRLAVVNAASSSGPFVDALSVPGRVVITATAGGNENLAPVFGGHFVTAFTEAADSDKDGRLSLREVFDHANRRVAESFEGGQRIRTEHALLDDNGDGAGSRSPGADAADGAVAARWFLSSPRYAFDSEAGRGLLARDQRLVDRIAQLKRRKGQMPSPDYLAELERLLVALALNRRALRAAADP